MYERLRNRCKIASDRVLQNALKYYLNLQTTFLVTIVFIFAFCLLIAPVQGQEALSFSRIAEGGFGNPHNSYTWSMEWFNDAIYVGTNRDILALRYIQKEHGKPTPPLDPWPVDTFEDPFWHDYDDDGVFDEGEGIDGRAEIWRYKYSPESGEWEWEMVHQADKIEVSILSEDTPVYVGEEYGYRKMLAYDGALYIATSITSTQVLPGARILRTTDGENFEVFSNWLGLTQGTVVSLRGLVSFKGRLYTTPVGEESFTNVIYESLDLQAFDPDEPWRPVCLPGFGDADNINVFEMAVFNGYLYAVTVNPFEGFQIWKTDGVTPDPDNPDLYKWTLVVTDGAYRGPLNETALSMVPFKGSDGVERLYVGGGILTGGHDYGPQIPGTDPPEYEWEVGPAPAEVIRITPGETPDDPDTWELVCGELDPPREDPEGNPIIPISGLPEGFSDPFTAYFWRMAEHDGWLYLSTSDNSTFLNYMPEEELPEALLEWLNDPEHPEHTVDYIVENTGVFDFWKTDDGRGWYPISWSGFKNHFNIGIRAMVSAPKSAQSEAGFFIGTANPFTQAEVPDGGCQVWRGTPGALNPPTNLQANFSSHQVKLRWTDSPEAIEYRVIRHTGLDVSWDGGKVTLVSPPPPPEYIGTTTEHFYVDTTVVQGKKYVYYIKANSGSGISDPSNVVGGIAEDIFFETIPGKLTYNRVTHRFVQSLTIINQGQIPLKSKVPIVLEGLTPNVILANQDGIADNGSPLVYAQGIPPEGGEVRIVLAFQNPKFARIKYIPFVVFGPKAVP